LKRCDEASTLAAVLSSTADLVKGYVNAVAANGVQWGGPAGANRHLVKLP
jgi:hypothetical protein